MDPQKIYNEIMKVGGFSYNADFISAKTYGELFDELGVTSEKKMTVIDVGAGVVPLGEKKYSTAYAEEIDERGVRLVPIDMNETRVRTWQLLPDGPQFEGDSYAQPVVADALHLPFQDSSVDGSISINLLNGFRSNCKENASRALSEIYRVLKPGGFLIISTYGYYRIVKKDGSEEYSDDFKPEDFVDAEFIKNSARELGFSSVKEVELSQKKIKESVSYWTEKKKTAKGGENIDRIDCVDSVGLLFKK
jgi:ubiquinone/menaquinone biosynthesis C-methylase UbiE